MRLIPRRLAEQVGKWAARRRINAFSQPPIVLSFLGLPTGGTPLKLRTKH